MHGPHDVGGRDGLGPIATEFLEPGIPDWRYPFEGRMHAVTAMAIAKGAFNLDEQRHGIDVRHPRYPLIPKVGMTTAPFLLAAAARPALQAVIDEGFDFDLIDAHYYYPDGVAAAHWR